MPARSVESPAPLYGLVLAGGRSRRMGTDKAALDLGDGALLERAVALLAAELEHVYVSVRPDQRGDALRARFRLVEDRTPEIGPAAGLLAAHAQQPHAAWLVIACDMPLLEASHVRTLIAARDPQKGATVWRTDETGAAEPLCAIYEPATLADFAASIRAGGSPSPREWLARVRLQRVTEPAGGALKSANTPAELREVQDALKSRAAAGKTDEQ